MGEILDNMIAGYDVQPGTPPDLKGKVLVYHKGTASAVYNMNADDADLQDAVDDNDATEFDNILSTYAWYSIYTAAQITAWFAAAKKAWAC